MIPWILFIGVLGVTLMALAAFGVVAKQRFDAWREARAREVARQERLARHARLRVEQEAQLARYAAPVAGRSHPVAGDTSITSIIEKLDQSAPFVLPA